VFTGDEYADGGEYIAQALSDAKIRASSFSQAVFTAMQLLSLLSGN